MVKNDWKWLILALNDSCEILGEYPYYCTIDVPFLESKWKSKNAKFSKFETLVFYLIKIQV